jgi:hypothetical protein
MIRGNTRLVEDLLVEAREASPATGPYDGSPGLCSNR